MTQPPTPVLSAEQRAWSYWFADGLPMLTAGVGSFLIAFFLLYSRRRPMTPVSVSVLLLALVCYGAVLLRHREIVEWLKAKITYPRTGYVSPPYFTEDQSLPVDFMSLGLDGADARRPSDASRVSVDRRKRMLVAVGMVLVVTAGTMLVQNRWICAAAGIVTAAALWLGAGKDERLSWIVLLGFPFTGFYITAFLATRMTGPERVACFLAGGGVLFVLEGALRLARYLRRHPKLPKVEMPQA